MTRAVVLDRDCTVSGLLAEASARLGSAGIASARLDARVLLMHVLNLTREDCVRDPDRAIDPNTADRYLAAIARRAGREPVSRITASREFWSLPFALHPEMLIPRPDSEILIEAALATVSDRTAPLRILDLGTGSGCLLLALLSELPSAYGIGVDISIRAASGAAANAAPLGLADRTAFLCADWSRGLRGAFDLVVTNPPYIPSEMIASLEPEVADHEPVLALDGGLHGLDAYSCIAPQLDSVLAPNGCAVIELGAGQSDRVAAMLERNGLRTERVVADLAGHPRCIVAGRA